MDTPLYIMRYTYGDGGGWGDLLTAYNGVAITYDEIGNPLSDGTWTYTWERGRQLKSMSNGSTTWNMTYDADGLRTSRIAGSNKYYYYYHDGLLTYMKYNSLVMRFTYDAQGRPVSMTYNGNTYYYALNLQGDVMALLDVDGNEVVSYHYNAWGKIINTTASTTAMLNTLAKYNPLRYRGYVYDRETGLYYLQSRYYNPEICRFINADGYTSTGQTVVGNNMFAYCGNNPVNRYDFGGQFWDTVFDVISLVTSIVEVCQNPDDASAWLGLAADTASLLIPCVSGGGTLVRVITKADDVVDVARVADDVADTAKVGWNVGENITNLTKAGNKPSWSTVRQRYWKNEAALNPSGYSASNLELMKKGKAPLAELNGKFYPMELHHKIPRHQGGSDAYENLLKVTPWDHAAMDKYRHFKP